MTLRSVVLASSTLPLLWLTACAASVDMGASCPPDMPSCGSAGASGASGGGGFGGASGGGGFAAIDGGNNRLVAEIRQQPSGLSITMVTLSCDGACAQVMAVAAGGNDPYTFVWSDGVTTAAREICSADVPALSVTVTDTEIVDGEFPYAAQTETASVTINALTCVDGGVPDVDASVPPTCDATLGGETVVSDVMGAITYYGAGATLPAGRYRISYVDGCMKFGPVNWTVHNFVGSSWFLVGDTSAVVLATLPGTLGFGYVDFDECVAANAAIADGEFDHSGGRIGVWLQDSPYTDNIEGLNGRNPTWCLSRIEPGDGR